MDDAIRIKLESAAFRALQKHLMEERPDVQNIDLMNLAGFCRNCLSRWFQEAAKENGIDLSKEEAREIFYGMPMDEWKTKYQLEVNSETEAKFQKAFSENVKSTDKKH